MSFRVRSWLESFLVGAGLCLAGAAAADGGALERAQLKEIAAEDGVPTVGKLKPTWCGRVSTENYTPTALVRMTGGYFIDNAAASIIAMCVAPDDPIFQEQVGYFVQQWVNYTGQTPAQLAEYFAKLAEPEKWTKQHEATCEKAAIPAESSEREQTLGEMKKAVLGCGYEAQTGKPFHYTFSLPTMNHGLWHYDRDAAPPSQLAAIYHVLACVQSADPKDLWRLGKFAGCRQDVKYLDDAALVAELKADGYNDYARIIAQQAMATARRRAAILEAALQQKAKDPDIKAVLLDAPEKAWKEWDALYRVNKDVIDAAHAYEDKFHGVRKSAAKGCLQDAHAALGAYMRAHTGKTADAVMAEATSPVGAILLERVRSCNETEGRKDVESAMAQLIEWGLPRRGPRYLAYVAMAEALSPILAERPKFAITGQMVTAEMNAPVEMGRKNDAPRWDKSGTVASVTKKGDTVHVAFKSETWTENEVFCTETNRIAMFSADGTPIYHRNCKGTGRRVQKSSTTEPFFTYPQMAEGITPGSFVRYRTGSNYVNMVFEGTPVEVWSGKDMQRLRATLGLAAAK